MNVAIIKESNELVIYIKKVHGQAISLTIHLYSLENSAHGGTRTPTPCGTRS